MRIRRIASGLRNVLTVGCACLVGGDIASAQSVSFSGPFAYPVGPNMFSVATRDFNGDGKLDLAVTSGNYSDGKVSILLGNGDGTFASAVGYAVGGCPFSVVSEDLNKDGKLDLAVSNFCGTSPNHVSILLGNGDGTFGAAAMYFAGFISPHVMVAGDLNRDGNLDLVVGGASLSMLLGNGNGSFAAPVTLPAGTNPFSVAIADFNADAKPDLAVANLSDNTISILMGNGDGTFQNVTDFAAGLFSPGLGIGVMAIADFNGDGKLDIAVADAVNTSVAVLLGDGAGGFGSPNTFGAATAPYSVTSVDLNGDGKLDLAVADFFPGTEVSVLEGDGNGAFGPATHFSLGVGVHPYMTAAGDFDVDGKLDLAAANDGLNAMVLLNRTAPPPPPPTTYGVCVLFDQAKAVKAGATIPVKLQLCDTNGANLSSSTITVTATSLLQISNNAPGPLDDAGNANPDFNFRFAPTLGGAGGYIFNLKTTGLTTGTYRLNFVATGDPTSHAVQFQVK